MATLYQFGTIDFRQWIAQSDAMTTSIKFDATLQDRVRRLAELRRCTPQWIMREAITQYVEREEKRESFKQEAMQAWQDYQVRPAHPPRGNGRLPRQTRSW